MFTAQLGEAPSVFHRFRIGERGLDFART